MHSTLTQTKILQFFRFVSTEGDFRDLYEELVEIRKGFVSNHCKGDLNVGKE